MERTTMKHLEKQLEYLNSFKDDYAFEFAYGGIKLTNKSQSRDILNSGFITKSKLLDLMRAYIAGVAAGIDSVKG